jgi:hypothetical protein
MGRDANRNPHVLLRRRGLTAEERAERTAHRKALLADAAEQEEAANLRLLARRIVNLEQLDMLIDQVKPEMQSAVRALLIQHVPFVVDETAPYDRGAVRILHIADDDDEAVD